MPVVIGWVIVGVVSAALAALAVVIGGKRRISSGPQAQDTSTNYRVIEAQSQSIRNQGSGFW